MVSEKQQVLDGLADSSNIGADTGVCSSFLHVHQPLGKLKPLGNLLTLLEFNELKKN